MFATLENNKRIAKNTAMLYVRMLFIIAVSLYTSRIILQALGVEDYGIYNAVGGVVAMFSIISGSLSAAISRYLTYEIGIGNKQKLNIIFCTSVNIQIVMSLIVMVIAEVVGVWFLNTKMNIPANRLYSANWVLQCSIITFMVNLISVPYNSLIIAHEKMSAFAYISILEVILKLVICYLLCLFPGDKLILWSVLLMSVSLIMRIVYGYYSKHHFKEAHYRFILDKVLLKDMSRFIGWAFFGNGVVVLKDQGSSILLNIYCGPVVNAAQGIAMQVNAAVYDFVNNFLMAVNPQITKSYSSGEISSMHSLILRSEKFAFFILLLIFFPLIANIDYVVGLWLTEVPKYTSTFIVLILLYSLLDCFSNPLLTGVLAEGNIKLYEICLTIIYLVNILASFLFLRSGFAPEWVFILNIIFKAFVICALLWQSHLKYDFQIRKFFSQVLLRSFAVFILCLLFSYFINIQFSTPFLNFILSAIVIFIFTGLTIYFIGLNKAESTFVIEIVKRKISVKR